MSPPLDCPNHIPSLFRRRVCALNGLGFHGFGDHSQKLRFENLWRAVVEYRVRGRDALTSIQ